MTADARLGFAAALGAYGLWGVLPLYFKLLAGTPPWVILAQRVLWAIPTVLLVLLVARKLADIGALLRKPRLLAALLASSLAVGLNWALYIWAVTHDRILEGSLGYFINPLISLALAAVFFGERFSPMQVGALGLAAAGVLNQALVVGEFPWVAMGLAVSFACYGAIRNVLPLDSRVGLLAETVWLAPIALGYLMMLPVVPGETWGVTGPGHLALLAAAGPITATPLILFAIGARRLRLSTLATLQFIGPTIQFGLGLAFGEPFTPQHAVTFACIWAGVALFTLSALRKEQTA